MRKLIALLFCLSLFVPFIAACEENEHKVERREKIEHRSDPEPVVTPDGK